MSPWTALLRTLLLVVAIALSSGCAEQPPPAPAPSPTPVPYRTGSFKVEAGSVYTVSLGANAGDKIDLSFDADLDINVRLVSPIGTELSSWDRVEQLKWNFTAMDTGVHSLRFDNSFSWLTAKNVDLRYRVTPAD